MVDLLQIWGEVLVNLDDTVPPECINTIRQAVISAIGKYDEGGFEVETNEFVIDFKQNIDGTDVEVIGNIYDDPKPLKGE